MLREWRHARKARAWHREKERVRARHPMRAELIPLTDLRLPEPERKSAEAQLRFRRDEAQMRHIINSALSNRIGLRCQQCNQLVVKTSAERRDHEMVLAYGECPDGHGMMCRVLTNEYLRELR